MTTETAGAVREDKVRIAASILCVLLVLASAYGPFLVHWPVYTYEFDSSAVVRGALALAGFIGMVVLSSHTGYVVTTLVLTGIAGVVALYLLGLGMIIAWTEGVHTFASSWRPIGGTFALLSPYFTPSIAAGALLVMRNRSRWARILVVVAIVGGSCVLSILILAGIMPA